MWLAEKLHYTGLYARAWPVAPCHSPNDSVSDFPVAIWDTARIQTSV